MANGEWLFLVAHVFKTHPDENIQLFTSTISVILSNWKEKALTRVNILPQLLLHIL